MRITIIGGGNVGTLMAGEFAHKGHDVTVFTSKPEKWSREITVLDNADRVLLKGTLALVTSDLEIAVKDADLIWIVVPAQLFSELGQKLERLVTPGQLIGVVPGSGGAEFAFHGILEKGAVLFGLQRVHSIARLVQYGHSVHMLGRKSRLELGAIPADKAVELSQMVSELFDLPCVANPNFLCVTLTPPNPILHTSGLYALFQDYRPGVVYPKKYLFYEEWSDLASEMLIACDAELQQLCSVIPLDLQAVMSLREYYESPTAEAMTSKISGIKAFQGITAPMVACEGGWIPDFDSRYFCTDFSYGLKVIKDLAVAFGVATPNMDAIWDWYVKFDPLHAENSFVLDMDLDDLAALYG